MTTEEVRQHPEYKAMLENLSHVQRTCNSLLDRNRALKSELHNLTKKFMSLKTDIMNLAEVYL